MLISLEKKLGINFDTQASLPINIGLQPDGIDISNKIIVEAYARIGKLKGSQLHKVKGDIGIFVSPIMTGLLPNYTALCNVRPAG